MVCCAEAALPMAKCARKTMRTIRKLSEDAAVRCGIQELNAICARAFRQCGQLSHAANCRSAVQDSNPRNPRLIETSYGCDLSVSSQADTSGVYVEASGDGCRGVLPPG